MQEQDEDRGDAYIRPELQENGNEQQGMFDNVFDADPDFPQAVRVENQDIRAELDLLEQENGNERQNLVQPLVVEVVPENFRLRDLEHYLDERGLRNEPVGIESELNVSEKQQRVEEAAAHQSRVHQEVFGNGDEGKVDNAKLEFLESFRDSKLIVRTLGKPLVTDVKSLATHCDAVYALASSHNLYKGSSSSELELSLESYSQASVEDFVAIVAGSKRPDQIAADSVVECCQIAHYLQCSRALEPLVIILVNAVDTDNCKSLLELADRLNLPLLFERSLSHMMDSLSETEDVWEDLTPELRDRVELMKKAVQSSVLAGTSRLYFSSLDEYLVIFAETLQYHRERLMDAKERQLEIRETHFIRSRGWHYNQDKIDRQEIRVRRLEFLMKEQKKIFGTSGGVFDVKKQQRT
mmetsp:Transcript_32001/g.52858  ORF Transcript_32001/g.52858 Transcript_32001/m.52858 type:complete len:410 (-) Transcript_32001:288-1517(-)